MQRHFDRDIEALTDKLLRMGAMVEDQISQSIRAMLERDTALAERVERRHPEVEFSSPRKGGRSTGVEIGGWPSTVQTCRWPPDSTSAGSLDEFARVPPDERSERQGMGP